MENYLRLRHEIFRGKVLKLASIFDTKTFFYQKTSEMKKILPRERGQYPFGYVPDKKV